MERITMKDIPVDERPYEKCLKDGPEGLSDAELLSIIIRTGSREDNSLALAQKILALNYPKKGILGLLHLSMPELMQVKGIGRVKGAQLLCIGELSRRIWKRSALSEAAAYHKPLDIVNYFVEDMRHREQELVFIMLLNTKGALIRDVMISQGTVNTSVVSPREIFIEAIKYHAVSLVLVHNHPSGDPSPSREDLSLTRRVKEAGELIGIQLLDHIIIGDNSYISLKERGIL
ncbi:RadC family protein [Clostridium sp. Marseille-P2415]|uniref:RadC family protein n=1 Tax=Clostridium sp. Marseille-P2415 TaxID=1805471 RepID=UPI000988922B|nr:DNA repair protein RadC [Clostridium sp. Marseille-P2415]